MSSSGAWIGMTPGTTAGRRPSIPRTRRRPPSAWRAAAAGTTAPGACGRPSGTGTGRAPRKASWGSAPAWLRSPQASKRRGAEGRPATTPRAWRARAGRLGGGRIAAAGDAVGSTAAPEARRLSRGMDRPRLAASARAAPGAPTSPGDAVGSTAAPAARRLSRIQWRCGGPPPPRLRPGASPESSGDAVGSTAAPEARRLSRRPALRC